MSVSDKLDSKFKADTKIDDTVTVSIKVTDVNEPPGKPDKPTLVTATTTSLKVKWDAPDMTGKPAIETYWIFYWPVSLTWDDRSVTNSYTNEVLIDEIHTGGVYPGLPLTPGTTYYVQVQAGNDEGYSPKSDQAKLATKSNASTPTNPPADDPSNINPPGNHAVHPGQPDANPDGYADAHAGHANTHAGHADAYSGHTDASAHANTHANTHAGHADASAHRYADADAYAHRYAEASAGCA